MDDQKQDAQPTEAQVITPANPAAPAAATQTSPVAGAQVFTPTDASAPEVASEVPQIHAQAGGADAPEAVLSNPLAKIVLWLFSGFITLFAAVLFNILLSLIVGRNPVINAVSYILGIAGVVLLFVGPYKAVKIFLQNK